MELSGKVHFIGQQIQVSETFCKRELVVKTDEQYPQFVSVNFIKDKCDLLNGLTLGQEVTVGINLRGREWTNPQGEVKYFNDIQGWSIKAGAVDNTTVNEPVFETTSVINQPENDLPF